MPQDTILINEILAILKKYYDSAPHFAPILDRRDTAIYVQEVINKIGELTAKVEDLEQENREE